MAKRNDWRAKAEAEADAKCARFERDMNWIIDTFGAGPMWGDVVLDADGKPWPVPPSRMGGGDILAFVRQVYGPLFLGFCRSFDQLKCTDGRKSVEQRCMKGTFTMRRFVLLLILVLLGSSSANAQTSSLTGDWLYAVCAARDQQGQTICQMWVAGFQAGIVSSQNLAQVNKLRPPSCIPSDVTTDQAKLVIEKFLGDNPQYKQLSAAMVAAYALIIAFPCPKL
jgi:hypothetical protein